MSGSNIQSEGSTDAIPVRLASAARVTRRARWRRARDVDDVALGGYLVAQALVEIRSLADGAMRHDNGANGSTHDEILSRIRFLANLCDNMPSCTVDVLQIRALAGTGARRNDAANGVWDAATFLRIHALAERCLAERWYPEKRGLRQRIRRTRPTTRHEQAMARRRLTWAWNTTGPEAHAWIVRHVTGAGLQWTPPPPLPAHRKGVPRPTVRQRAGLLVRWPVKGRAGSRRLPTAMRVVKAVDGVALRVLNEEAGRLRLGLGSSSPWLDAHLAPEATHYLVPHPTIYWPDPEAGRPWWQCTALVRMADGERVKSMIAVMPETFQALPSALPRLHQRRLAQHALATERDTYLWGRDHEALCSPDACGYRSVSAP